MLKKHLFYLLIFSGSLIPAQYLDLNFPIPDGPVHSLAVYGNELIVGGSFDDVGLACGHAASLDTITGNAQFPFPFINGPVHALATDSSGNWYLGGVFSRVGDLIVSNLVRIMPNGLPDPTFLPEPDGPVYTLMTIDSLLYVGGAFMVISGMPRTNVASIDLSTGFLTAWDPSPNGRINALAVDPMGLIYLGGVFTFVGSDGRTNLARVDPVSGDTPFEFLDFDFVMNGPVRALCMVSDTLFVGGDFTAVNFTSRQYLAAIRATVAETLLSFNHSLNSKVRALAARGGTELIFGGDFTIVDTKQRSRIASILLNGDTLSTLSVGANGPVHALYTNKWTLYVGGSFSKLGITPRKNIGAIDSGGTLLPAFDPLTGDETYCILKSAGKIVAGGKFINIQCKTRKNLCAIDIPTGTLLSWRPDPSAAVHCMAVYGNDLYIGGDFTSIDSLPRSHVAYYMMPGYVPGSMNVPVNGPVRTLLKSANKLWVGGLFTTVGGQPRDNLAMIDLSANAVSNYTCHVNGTVNTLDLYNDQLYAGGYFTVAEGLPRLRIVRTDTVSGAPDPYWYPSFDDGIYSLKLINGDVFAGGWFTTVNGIPRSNFSMLDNQGNVGSLNPSPSAPVRTLYHFGDTLLLGGHFSSFSSQFVPHTAALDLGSSSSVPFFPGGDSLVNCFQAYGSSMFTGGAFHYAPGIYHPFLARYTAQPVIGSGEDAVLGEMQVFPNPSDGLVTGNLPAGMHEGTLRVYGMDGKLVMETVVKGASFQCDLGFLKEGVYLLSVVSGTQVFRTKIMIAR